MSRMKKRKRGERIWTDSVDDIHDTSALALPTPIKVAPRTHYGLEVNCLDKNQGLYQVVKDGNGWLVARGVDGEFDIIEEPLDIVSSTPNRNRVITAVKVFVRRNE